MFVSLFEMGCGLGILGGSARDGGGALIQKFEVIEATRLSLFLIGHSILCPCTRLYF